MAWALTQELSLTPLQRAHTSSAARGFSKGAGNQEEGPRCVYFPYTRSFLLFPVLFAMPWHPTMLFDVFCASTSTSIMQQHTGASIPMTGSKNCSDVLTKETWRFPCALHCIRSRNFFSPRWHSVKGAWPSRDTEQGVSATGWLLALCVSQDMGLTSQGTAELWHLLWIGP